MARFTSGWFKCYRDASNKDLFDNMYLWSIWHALLHMATWKESKVMRGGKQLVLPPGSVVLGLRELSDRWGCSKRTISKWLNYLNDTGRIVRKSCAQGTIITICNWEIYQSNEEEACALSIQEVPTRYPLGDHLVDSIEERRKKKEEEEENTYVNEPNLNRGEESTPEGSGIGEQPVKALAEMWNSSCPSLPQVQTLNASRTQKAKVRWGENPDREFWLNLFSLVEANDFLTGRKGKKEWRANFDWILNETNMTKVLEGNYGGVNAQPKYDMGF